MFSRTVIQVSGPCAQQARGMATLKEISARLKAVTNIQKITKSMKMVSAAKFAKAERELRPARAYGLGQKEFFEKVEVPADEKKPQHLIVAMTSDRGLCGAAHTNIARAIKAAIPKKPAGTEFKLICVGDKSRGILSRIYSQNILMHFYDIGRQPPTFDDAGKIASEIINCGYQFDYGEMYFNVFRSVVAYTTTPLPIYTLEQVSQAEKLNLYDSLDEEVLRSYNEFALANLTFYCLKEAAASENSQRMTAMDGASKNAGEMIDKLRLAFNRTRQAVITRELIEIISGAAALK
jgi:F-type H+-transporting ATPase subunit gamma